MTQQKRSQAEIEAEAAALRDPHHDVSLFEDAPVACHEIDCDGVIRRMNRAESELLGRSRDELIGHPVWEFVAPERREASQREVHRKMAEEQEIAPFIREYIRSDGQKLSLEIHEKLIRDQEGRVRGMRSTLLDVSKRVQAEERVRAMYTEMEQRVELRTRELHRSNEELQAFAYTVSHDLQEPLRNISAYAQLLSRRTGSQLDEDSREFLAFILDSAKRLDSLVRDVLAYSRALHEEQTTRRPVSMQAVMERVVENLSSAIAESEAQIIFSDLPDVLADHQLMIQLLQNLVSNAIKYRAAAPPVIQVRAQVMPEGEVQFSVQDNGVGIEKAQQEIIFTAFKRLHGRDVPGTGLGLSIAQRILHRLGGRIWVESTPGDGSTFFFSLPGVTAPSENSE